MGFLVVNDGLGDMGSVVQDVLKSPGKSAAAGATFAFLSPVITPVGGAIIGFAVNKIASAFGFGSSKKKAKRQAQAAAAAQSWAKGLYDIQSGIQNGSRVQDRLLNERVQIQQKLSELEELVERSDSTDSTRTTALARIEAAKFEELVSDLEDRVEAIKSKLEKVQSDMAANNNGPLPTDRYPEHGQLWRTDVPAWLSAIKKASSASSRAKSAINRGMIYASQAASKKRAQDELNARANQILSATTPLSGLLGMLF